MGGAERMAVNISNALSNDSSEIFLLVSRKKGPLAKFLLPEIPLIHLEKRKFYDLKAFLLLIKTLKKIKPDLIHAHGTSIYWAVFASVILPSIKIIWHDHLGVNEEVIVQNPRRELKILSKWIDGIITVNPSIRDWWISELKFNSKYIRYIKNFPYLIPKKNKYSNEVLRLVHVANFRKEKGHLNLLNACKLLKKQNRQFQLRMVGQFTEPELHQLIVDEIEAFQLQDQIKVIGPVEDIASELSKADVGLVCSDREGLPVALLEYGLSGLQVISTEVGNCGEVLGGGDFGYLVQPNDYIQLANTITYIAENKVEAANKASLFQNHVKTQYGAKQFLNEYFDFIRVL
jgi:glycosyltransferase involved in cell wall biosynthesis